MATCICIQLLSHAPNYTPWTAGFREATNNTSFPGRIMLFGSILASGSFLLAVTLIVLLIAVSVVSCWQYVTLIVFLSAVSSSSYNDAVNTRFSRQVASLWLC